MNVPCTPGKKRFASWAFAQLSMGDAHYVDYSASAFTLSNPVELSDDFLVRVKRWRWPE